MMVRFLIFITAIALTGCGDSPKVISATSQAAPAPATAAPRSETTPGSSATASGYSSALHQVKVEEVLQATRYVYLKVLEGDQSYWIATRKQEIQIGGIYYYRNGLLKTNFESKEHQRVFDKIYLVSNLVAENHGSQQRQQIETHSDEPASFPSTTTTAPAAGGVTRLGDILDNPKAYEGKTVRVSGACVKINSQIMGRNWVHLEDGSQGDYDFVITTNDYVAQGAVVTLEGVVSLDRDFGSGYRYALIVENGKVIN